ncbi:PaaX family transcriptional regulator [Leucobacter aridicollis]|uniref:Phenylacetic acid degradation operon negative regulatory protein n=1 Tax=Leucobacter aridicollis TaxID=283878 RepID=A0A852R3P8_9MICO|nr:PaaX family transcriptional regulator [Leucobacter aridicollis]MBL3682746.1 PaaX family transcriptional regulator [Leucobacter aridicollis]NYD26185.1 phenylacetic acid degradation operon negative regulatory protein [Leucobacter aridicollis]
MKPPLISVSARTLIEGSFDAAGAAQLAAVYDVGLALGIPEQTVRLTLRRMQSAGELTQVGRGRAGRIERTSDARARSRRDGALVAFAFAQDAGAAPWDGAWHLYAFSVPEPARAERDALRAALTWLGAAPVVAGMYVSPHELSEELAGAVAPSILDRWLVRGTTADLAIPGASTPRQIAEALWPAEATLAAYAPLAKVLAVPAASPLDGVAATARALQLSEGLDRALAVDPLLPGELRDSSWQPRRLRDAFAAEWAALQRGWPALPVFS